MFRLELTVSVECAECGRDREPEAAALVAQGDRALVARVDEPCPQCGGRRVTVRPRVRAGPTKTG